MTELFWAQSPQTGDVRVYDNWLRLVDRLGVSPRETDTCVLSVTVDGDGRIFAVEDVLLAFLDRLDGVGS